MNSIPRESGLSGLDRDMLLGRADESSEVARRYEALRQNAAHNVLSSLQTEDAEYIRRQGIINYEFLDGVRRYLPEPQITADTSSSGFRLSAKDAKGKIDYEGHISNIEASFRVDVAKLLLGNMASSTLVDLAAIRSATIWRPVPVNQAFSVTNRGEIRGYLKQDEPTLPHVLVGARTPVDRPNETNVLLLPLVRNGSGYRHNSQPVFTTHVGPANSVLSGIAEVHSVPYVLEGKMPTASYTDLITMQDILLEEGLEQEEITATHEPDGSFVINPDRLAVVGAKEAYRRNWLGIRTEPMVHGRRLKAIDLESVALHNGAIEPQTFVHYNVLQHTQRLAAMFGGSDRFESEKEQLASRSLADPALKMLDRDT